MKQTYSVKFCLDDFKNGRDAVNLIFDVIAKVKAAVFAQAGVVKDFSYDNTLDREENLDGSIATLRFEVLTVDDYQRELVVDHFAVESGLAGVPPRVFPMVRFERVYPVKQAVPSPAPVRDRWLERNDPLR